MNVKNIGLSKKPPVQPTERPKLQEIPTQSYSQEMPLRQDIPEEKTQPIKKSKLKTKRPLRGLPKKPSKKQGNP
jgi:hypothetical protein